MKFIPMDETERLEYLDEESNITYLIRPNIGEIEIQAQDLMTKLKVEKDNTKAMKLIDDIFDLFIAGWRSTTKIKDFPEDGKPSKMFPFTFKNNMINIIYSLNNLDEDEKKS